MPTYQLIFLVPLVILAAPLSEIYRDTATRLINAALSDDGGYAKLSYLCDRIGNRLGGSESLNRAIAWAAAEMKKDGLVNVVTPEVMVPQLVRGRERLTMIAPTESELVMLGLGDSVSTPPEGVTADVVVVHNFEDLDKLGRRGVEGRIVSTTFPTRATGRPFAIAQADLLARPNSAL